MKTVETTKLKCLQQLPCLNGAKQNPVTCKCECKLKKWFKYKKKHYKKIIILI